MVVQHHPWQSQNEGMFRGDCDEQGDDFFVHATDFEIEISCAMGDSAMANGTSIDGADA